MSLGYSSYGSLESEVMAASPVGLVRLLYQGALDAIAMARQHLQAGDIAARSRAITKAQLIVPELSSSLKTESGELATSLSELYAFVQERLARANFLQIEQPLADAERVLKSLQSAWSELDPARQAEAPFENVYQPPYEQRTWVG
jgi:flagellar protein FliS